MQPLPETQLPREDSIDSGSARPLLLPSFPPFEHPMGGG